MPKIIYLFIFSLIINSMVYSQNQLAVDIDHPVYDILEIAEIKGAITSLPIARPFSENTIINYLEMANENNNILSTREKEIIKDFLELFNYKRNGPRYGNLFSSGNIGLIWLGLKEESDFRINFNRTDSFHMHNAITFYTKGTIGDHFSFSGDFGFTYDMVRTESFAPYSFTKEWDGFHLGFTEPRYSYDGREKVPYFSFILENDIAAQFLNDNLTLRFSRFRRDWSVGNGSLFLSESARPYQGIDIHARLASWLNISYSIGSLSNSFRERDLSSGSDLSFQKMITTQMFEIFPNDWFYISTAGIAIWSKRFELGYMNPLMYPVIHQNLHGNFDNVAVVINMRFRIAKYVKIYSSLFIDEMEFVSPRELFNRPRNMFAYQLGIKFPVPRLPFTQITFQYTKIEPFVYAHYPEEYSANMATSVDMSYTHDDENIGYNLPPNSDEFLIEIKSMFKSNLSLFLQYKLIRHGTNDPSIAGDFAIYGDIDIYFNYDDPDAYPDKDFLHDGLYDWNNIVTLGANYTFPKLPITLSGEYIFSYTSWEPNDSGIVPPDNVIKNIIVLEFSIFY